MKNMRIKLLVPTVIMTIFCLGVIAYISYRQHQSFEAISAQTTINIQNNVQQRLAKIQTLNRNAVDIFTNNWQFIDHVSLNDTGKILDRIVPFHTPGYLDIINAYDTTGNLLASAENPGRFGSRDEVSPVLHDMPSGDEHFCVAVINNEKLALIVIKRMVGNYGTIGYLAVGQYLTPATLSGLASTDPNRDTALHFYYQGKSNFVLGCKDIASAKEQKTTTFALAQEIDAYSFLSVRLIEDTSLAEKSFWRSLQAVIVAFSCVSLIVIVFSRSTTMGVARELEQRVHNRTVELRSSERRFSSLVEQIPDALFVCDLAGKLLLVNHQSCLSLGYQRDEILKMTIGEIDPLFAEQGQPNPLWQKLISRKSITFESEHKRHDGSTFPVEIHTGFIELGDTKAILGMARNISARKQATAELQQHREHLEELVKERTQQLQQKTAKLEKSSQALTYLLEDVNQARAALQQANSDYAAANNELKEFAYSVSHDLKAPLRAISQLTHWISEDYSAVFDDDGREQMALILKRVKRLDDLIDGILRYSRIGRVKEKNEQLDLNMLVNEIIASLAPPENVQISVANKLPVVSGDPTRMGQVFQNLIGNAIKFMDKDEGIIQLDCAEEGEFWKFSVADNGPGIDKKYHDRIFQIFQTLTARDEHENTGIGLTLVKKIIKLYGGSVWLESEAGRGTTFFFTLPKKGV